MTEILETDIRLQRPIDYGHRYTVTVVTELFYYELIYRFIGVQNPFLTLERSTYGNIHDRKSGFTRVIQQENAILEHARRTVQNIEKDLKIF